MKYPLWLNIHSDKCCKNAPAIGTRWRRRIRDIWTGEDLGYEYYTVVKVGEFRPHHMGFCREVWFKLEGGLKGEPWTGRCASQDFLSGFEALDNVVTFTKQNPASG